MKHDFKDGKGEVPAHQHSNGGGWVADSATVADSAYVGPDARVSGNALVSGDAQVSGNARVCGDARIGTEITGYDLSGVPIVPGLDVAIRDAVAAGALDMATWHTCQTTHCRAGWAITLAGAEGAALEARVGPWLAGALIYVASTGRTEVPDFFATTEDARADIDRCAAMAAQYEAASAVD